MDEWLINELNLEEIQFLFEIIEGQSSNQSTIFCTQYKTSEWHEKLGAGIPAEAIIDRLSSVEHKIALYIIVFL